MASKMTDRDRGVRRGVARRRAPTVRHAGGFSLIEAVLCMVIVGGLLVAAMNTLGAAAMGRRHLAERVRAETLADDLLCEILLRPYEDPSGKAAPAGPDENETALKRITLDDVDDYEGLRDAPPTTPEAAPIPGYDGWVRVVEVRTVSPYEPVQEQALDAGVKRITVRVEREGRVLAERVALRTRDWPLAPLEEPE